MSKRNYQCQKRDDSRHLATDICGICVEGTMLFWPRLNFSQPSSRSVCRRWWVFSKRRVEAEPSPKNEVFVDFSGLFWNCFKRFPSLFRRPSLEVLASTVTIRVRASILRKTLSSCGRFTYRNRRLGLAKSYCADTDFSQKCNVWIAVLSRTYMVIQERQKAAQAPWFPSRLSDWDLLGMRRLWAFGLVVHNRATSRIGHNCKIYETFCRFLKNSASTFWHVNFAAKILFEFCHLCEIPAMCRSEGQSKSRCEKTHQGVV